MTDGDERELKVDLSFLSDGNHTLEIFLDGVNANKYASDYKRETYTVTKDENMVIKLAKGGGWVARIK